MSWYQPVAVAPDLQSVLVCGWTANVAGQHLLVPDGCVDVLWIDSGRVVVCGPETTAWPILVPSGTQAVGVRFRPGVAPGMLQVSANALRDSRVALDDLLDVPTAYGLGQRVGEATTPAERLAVLLAETRRLLHERYDPDPLVTGLAQALASQSVPITELAEATGSTQRQLQRRSLASFGYSPATLRRILRLQRFMALARSTVGRSHTLTELAYLAGYSDQAHLANDSRRIAAMTPSQLLASQAPDWHGPSTVVGVAVEPRAA